MKSKEMSFWEHVGELRKRLVLSFIIVIVLGAVCYAYWDYLLAFILKPAGKRELIYLNVMEPFVARFKLALWGGLIAGFPLVLYQIMAFVVPGLKRKEKIFLILMVFFMVLLFFSGIYFGYKYVLKVGINWLEAQGGGIIKPNLTVSQYISFVGLFLMAFGISFETPVVIVVLARVGAVRPITLIKQWRVAIVIILFAAAIITPDWSPITMGLMAAPMLILYILGVGLSFIFAPRKKALKQARPQTL